MGKVMSLGEELQELLDLGLGEDDANAIMNHRHRRITPSLKCLKCDSTNTYRRGKHCSHEYKCCDCGYWWCAYYQLMSPEERSLRKAFNECTVKGEAEEFDVNVYEKLEKYNRKVAVGSVPSEEYLRKLEVFHKYDRLGFRAKASRLSDELEKIGPVRSGNFLWTSLNLRRFRVWRRGIDHCNRPVPLYGIMLERVKEKRKALVLIPRNQWIGDIPEEILDHALLNKHNFKSMYVAPIVSGYVDKEFPDTHLITRDLNGLVSIAKIDPLLLGSYRREIEQTGPANFAVLGVWGDDWFDLKLPDLETRARTT